MSNETLLLMIAAIIVLRVLQGVYEGDQRFANHKRPTCNIVVTNNPSSTRFLHL